MNTEEMAARARAFANKQQIEVHGAAPETADFIRELMYGAYAEALADMEIERLAKHKADLLDNLNGSLHEKRNRD